eukprot:scaffold26322_cov29-Tisochrysis_lutea.AAC.1
MTDLKNFCYSFSDGARAAPSPLPAPCRHDAPQGPTQAAGAEAPLTGRCPSRPRRRHGPAAPTLSASPIRVAGPPPVNFKCPSLASPRSPDEPGLGSPDEPYAALGHRGTFPKRKRALLRHRAKG